MGKLGLKLVFRKSISSHTHAFLFLIFNALRHVIKKSGYFSKKMFFPDFRLIQSDFRSIEILLKNFSEPLSGSIDRTCFSINRTSWIRFLKKKNSDLTCSSTFSKLFQTFLSLSLTWQGSTKDFLSFSAKFFARFFSPKAGKTFIPLLLLLFSWFHA